MTIPLHNLARKHLAIKPLYEPLEKKVYETGRFFNGEMTERLETALCRMTGYKYCVLVNSGTTGLYTLARFYKRFGLDEVYVPRLTFRATHNAFRHEDYTLQLLDYTEDTYLAQSVDVSGLVVRVGLFGKQPVYDYPNALFVIDDACQNWINCKSKNDKVISFDPTKIVSSNGSGGAVLTNNPYVSTYARQLSQNSLQVDGLNLRMSELEAAYVLAQLPLLDDWMERRKEIMNQYKNAFGDALIYNYEPDHDLQKAVIRLMDSECNKQLNGTQYLYKDLCPELNLLSLPLYPELTHNEVCEVIKNVKDVLCQ